MVHLVKTLPIPSSPCSYAAILRQDGGDPAWSGLVVCSEAPQDGHAHPDRLASVASRLCGHETPGAADMVVCASNAHAGPVFSGNVEEGREACLMGWIGTPTRARDSCEWRACTEHDIVRARGSDRSPFQHYSQPQPECASGLAPTTLRVSHTTDTATYVPAASTSACDSETIGMIAGPV